MPYPENKEFEKLLLKLGASLTSGKPFAIYRKPGQQQVTVVGQTDTKLNITQDFSERGFVLAPFDWQDNAILIRADEVFTTTFQSRKIPKTGMGNVSDLGKPYHVKLVQKGMEQINSGRLRKVVLSRKVDLEFQQSPLEVFTRLLDNYPNALCYLVHHPAIGSWCGATPETLVEIKKGKLKTMSLAATLPYLEDKAPAWGAKEIEEQEMVSNYILEQLSRIGHSLEMGAVESVKAGNLWHLKSEIKGRLDPGTPVMTVVKALHPTPAVCGIPTMEAKRFILGHEGYERGYYTGFLGELNLGEMDEATLFVNLRCMEIKQGKASVFVGGGITSASDPEKEWTETQNKSKTLLNILQFAQD